MQHIEQAGAARIRNVRGEISCELQSHEILRQENMANAAVKLRLVIAYPEQFGQSEAGQNRVSRGTQNVFRAKYFIDLIHLLLAALIAPDQSRTDDLALLVEQDQAVHLTAESNPGYRGAINSRVFQNAPNRGLRRMPPVVGILFRPQWFQHLHFRVRRHAGEANTGFFVYQQRSGAARTYIES